MKKEYIKPVAETIIVADNFLTAQSDVDLVFDPTIEDEGFAD